MIGCFIMATSTSTSNPAPSLQMRIAALEEEIEGYKAERLKSVDAEEKKVLLVMRQEKH